MPRRVRSRSALVGVILMLMVRQLLRAVETRAVNGGDFAARSARSAAAPNADPASDPFYVGIDKLIAALRADGRTAEAARIHELAHEMAWTTSTEFIGELRTCFTDILHARPA